MTNTAKQKLAAGQSIAGSFVAFHHPDMCEWLAHIGFGAPLKWDESRYVNAFEQPVHAARATGEAAGTVTNDLDLISWLIKLGHRALLVGEADAFLLRGVRMALDAGRGVAV